LTLAGDVELFCVVSERPDLQPLPREHTDAMRVSVHHRAPFGPSTGGMLRWLRTGWPRAVAWREWDGAAAALAAFVRPPYDLVWYVACGTWLGLGGIGGGPAVVDFNDLEDVKLRTLRRMWKLQRAEGAPSSPRRSLGTCLDTIDERRWRRVELQAADSVGAVVVCSELDRRRLGRPGAVVVPNSYELAHPTPPARGDEPVFTMVGLLTYPPNADAAAHFAHAVLPIIRKELPAAVFQLVGRYDDAARRLAAVPGVRLLGPVEDLDPVFASTSAVVVPLRAGGGTRIKILEAFARSVPVVSTALGCEGLDVRSGTELLVADSPQELAAACIRVHEDAALAASLVEHGHALWESRYRAAEIRAQVSDLAREIARG
jgi:glycosyltransferase involved in cell wall biosynthesis